MCAISYTLSYILPKHLTFPPDPSPIIPHTQPRTLPKLAGKEKRPAGVGGVSELEK